MKISNLKDINWEEGFRRLYILGIIAYWVWLIVVSVFVEECFVNIFDECELLIWYILGGIAGSLYGFKLLKYIANVVQWIIRGFYKK